MGRSMVFIQRLDCFFSRALSPPLLFFSLMFVGLLIKVFGSSKSCSKLDALEKK